MSAAEVLRQAEELKAAVADTSRCANEVWVSRQALQDIYQKLLVIDLEFALDKKVEQDLWNHAFKKQINTLQTQAKDKQNQKRGEVQSSLNLFLETASGFYLHLLQAICSAFKLDLPFRKNSSNYGIIREYGPVMAKIKTPKRSSCMYICQDCLVHLGDIARYRQQVDQAQAYYRHAAHLVPYNGQPYNQLAILEAAKGNKLSTVFFHIRSIAVKHPFPVAMTNLEKFYVKISKDSHDYRQKLTANELIGTFLQLHAFIFLCVDFAKAKSNAERLLVNLPIHIASSSFSSYQLVQMVAINLFSLYHSKRKLNNSLNQGNESHKTNGKNKNMEALLTNSGNSKDKAGANLKSSFDLLFDITLSTFEVLLQSTPKDEVKVKEFHTLAPIKVLLDWLHTDPDSLSNSAFKTSSVWIHLSELLNSLQFSLNQSDSVNTLQKRLSTPLPEDCDLECFLPVSKAHSDLTYYSTSHETMTEDMETNLRCQKLIMSGFWIAEEFPSLNLVNVQQLTNGHWHFSTQIKPVQGNNGDLKATRQNVAIQAIMQKGYKETAPKKCSENVTNHSSRHNSAKAMITEPKDTPEKLDAGVMAHTLLGKDELNRSDEKNFNSWSSIESHLNSQQDASSSGSPQSISTDTSYFKEHLPVPLPSTTIGPSQQPLFPYFVSQQGTSQMFTRPPSGETQILSHLPNQSLSNQLPQPGGIIGQRLMTPVEHQPFLHSTQNGIPFSGPVTDGQPPPQFDYMGTLYAPGVAGFVPREQLAPAQNQTFFRIGQPLSFTTSMVPQPPPRHMVPMPMGMVPPQQQLQWSRAAMMQQRMPFVAYPTLSEPPPKLSSQGLVEEFPLSGTTGFSQLGFSQRSPTSCRIPDQEMIDAFNRPPSSDRDGFLFASAGGEGGFMGLGGRFPSPSQMQTDPMNGNDQIGGMTFPHLGYGGIEPGLNQQRYCTHPRPGLYSIRNGIQMSNILDNLQGPVLSQPSGLFQAEQRILDELDLMPRSPDEKDILKPESPQPIGARLQSNSYYMTSGTAKKEQQPTSNMYSLFSQSPWPVSITKSTDGNSHASSTFGSSNSSLRTTPDLDERSSTSSGGAYRAGLFNRPLTSSGNSGPWNTPSLSNNTSTTVAGAGSLLTNNLQSLWNSGPSPLEKLLEQQKQQRQCEPR